MAKMGLVAHLLKYINIQTGLSQGLQRGNHAGMSHHISQITCTSCVMEVAQ